MSANPDFREKLRAVPLLGALVPMVAGIVLGTLVPAPLYVWITAVAVCCATAWITLSRRIAFSTLHVALGILFLGAALAHAHTPQQVVPQEERVWLNVLITDDPVHREGWRSVSTFGTVTGWQSDDRINESATGVPVGEWQPANERLLVSVDTMWRFSAGDRVVFRSYINPVSDSTNSYSRLMRARGYTGRTHISQYSHPKVVAAVKAKAPVAWAKKLQSAATGRLHRLDTEVGGSGSDAIAVATAMTTGDKSGITPGLRRIYSHTGASHLLAVSGLHVGIVFLIINALLYLLPLPGFGAPKPHRA